MKLAHISRDEVAVTIIAAWHGVERPANVPAEFLLADLPEEDRQRFVRIADAVTGYIAGCMERADDVPETVN